MRDQEEKAIYLVPVLKDAMSSRKKEGKKEINQYEVLSGMQRTQGVPLFGSPRTLAALAPIVWICF